MAEPNDSNVRSWIIMLRCALIGPTTLALALAAVVPASAQSDVVKSEGITSPLHRANVGRIVFTRVGASGDSLKESDMLTSLELSDTKELGIRAFLGNSLTNYLHGLAPEMAASELLRKGNYQFSFIVDGAVVHKENFHPAWLGSAENKNTKTVFSAALINPASEQTRWGPIWHVFMLNGGAEALAAGKHVLRVELRPYLRTPELKVGAVLAAGELQLNVMSPRIEAALSAVRPIQPGSGWAVSNDKYDREKIAALKRKIAENVYKDIKSIVVIKSGKLLIEEYFNGAGRDSLQNTRSVGKSFASTLMGLAIEDGHIKSELQTLGDFYDLTKFANYSTKKASVTLKHLMTMSSGFDANDDDESSPGNEEKMYPTDDWVKFALDLPMDDKTVPGEQWRYFTAGVVVLGDVMHKSVPGGLEKFAHQKLFQPLGIRNYRWSYTPQNVPGMMGGLQMSALDFARYGQLYKNGGVWEGRQIVPRAWVEKTSAKHINLPGGNDSYGYLFWNGVVNSGGKQHEILFATGNGGNKIYIFKDQPLVVVVTATAFGRWYMHRQVFSMMEKYIVPSMVN